MTQHFFEGTNAPETRNILIRVNGHDVNILRVRYQPCAFTVDYFDHAGTQWVATFNVMSRPLRFNGCFRKRNSPTPSATDCGILYCCQPGDTQHASAWGVLRKPSRPRVASSFASDTGALSQMSLPPSAAHAATSADTTVNHAIEEKSEEKSHGTPSVPSGITDKDLGQLLHRVADVALSRGIIRGRTHGMLVVDRAQFADKR